MILKQSEIQDLLDKDCIIGLDNTGCPDNSIWVTSIQHGLLQCDILDITTPTGPRVVVKTKSFPINSNIQYICDRDIMRRHGMPSITV